MLPYAMRPKYSHREFARRVASCLLSQTQAYLLTYPTCRSRAAAAAAASRLMRRPDVHTFYWQIRREQAEYFERQLIQQREAELQREKAMMDANFARMLRR